ncbi:hypothetical protein LTR64_005162 [Lithohypha guttulata]|uniref:Transcription factor CBF/NF-Y/archaeal histone domain-containing protein n=1 Tax=Lithohypha guttulata TaxID=1690604 RepID=A0AAN7T2P1_9EURO|nr:hypothetical protein LTR51_005005 [Lithohypha guttulata]KAK5087753.1 hypothetical protein LTR05_001968 [Lithohypha guttulata]
MVLSKSKRTYPRATIRKIIKAHCEKNVGRNVDALIYLDYILFVQRLMQNATRKAKEADEKRLQAKDIRKVTMTNEIGVRRP